MGSFAGRICLVTGGASGIGKALCAELVKRGGWAGALCGKCGKNTALKIHIKASVVSRKYGAKKLHAMITPNGVNPVHAIINGHIVF
jgi:NAD(P)-dependent dehydrogenase (short-subunit alcohol dehydrogenase family)